MGIPARENSASKTEWAIKLWQTERNFANATCVSKLKAQHDLKVYKQDPQEGGAHATYRAEYHA